MYTISPINKKT